MVDVSIRFDGDRPLVELQGSKGTAALVMDPGISFREGGDLVNLLRNYVLDIHLEAHPSNGRRPEAKDWRTYLVKCACGRTFPDSGLGGLGKHSSNCQAAQAHLHIGTNSRTTIYRQVIEAIHSWNQEDEFTVPLLREQFENHGLKISDSSLRGHMDWLEAKGFVNRQKDGRSVSYEFVRPPLTSGWGENNG